MAHTPTLEQKQEQAKALVRAIDRICDAWADAEEAAAARGYLTASPGPSEAPALKSPHDKADPLHARTMSPAKAGHGGGGDGGMVAHVSRPDVAGQWLNASRRHLAVLLWFSTAADRGERRWTGPFNPPALRANLKAAATELIDWWPKNVDRLLQKIVSLANFACQEWPATPKAGTTVDGVKVLEKGNAVEVCAECHQPAVGGALDPVVRFEGKVFHRKPCYNTAWQRQNRKKGQRA